MDINHINLVAAPFEEKDFGGIKRTLITSTPNLETARTLLLG
jgi:hypothetical protein